MTLVRLAAACMAGWSLYVVARHYHVPALLSVVAGLVFDGVAYMCLRMASDAVRAGRSAAGPVLATIGMAGISIYLNLVHAQFTGGGRPAEVLYASPAVGLLIVSALAWAAERATARAERGETPMRMPAYGALGWVLAREQAITNLRERAVAHVTSSSSAAHQPASALPTRTAEDVIAADLAEIGPAAAVQRVAAAQPNATDEEIAATLATYRVAVTPGQVALLLERAAVPTARLDRLDRTPQPPTAERHPALNPARAMRGDAPDASDNTKAGIIRAAARRLGGLNAEPAAVARQLGWPDTPRDTNYIRTTLSRARRDEAKAAEAAALEAAEQAAEQAEYERRHGNGGYA
jgi:hypothetical protein